MLYLTIVLLALITNAPADVVEVDAALIEHKLTKKASQWADVVSSEYYIRLPKGRLRPGASRRIEFTLPGAGGGQVPCGALVYGLNFKISDTELRRWNDVADRDIAITVKIPGSNGPATYTQKISSDEWQKSVFELPVGPGDDVATDSWQLIIANRTSRRIKYASAHIRLLLRYD